MKRIPIIDFVRFGSVVAVLGGHFFPQWMCRSIPWPGLQEAMLNFFHHGFYGVSCFFVVSGFLITEMLVQGRDNLSTLDLKAFYVRRVARILPLILLTVIVALLLEQGKGFLDTRVQAYHVWDDESGFGWLFWISLVTFTFNWYLTGHFWTEGFQWSILWSLAVEEQFYLCYPLILRSLRTRRRVWVFLSLVILSGTLFRWWLYLQKGPVEGASPTPAFLVLERMASFANFDQLAVGCALYFIQERWGNWLEKKPWVCSALFWLGVISCVTLFILPADDGRTQLIWGPLGVAVSCAAAVIGGLHLRGLNSHLAQILSWPGKLSYGCYLWHPTVTFLLMPILVVIGGMTSFICLIAALLLFAFLSYRFFEVPINRAIRSKFGLGPSPLG